jgi:hypothetical protein
MKFGVTYFPSQSLRHETVNLEAIQKSGFSYVVHTITEFDFEYRQGNIRDVVKATRDLGMQAHANPWAIGKVFGGEVFSNFVSRHYLDACQVMDDDSTIPMACPNAPAFVDYLKRWVDFVIDIGADVVFWDEPHFHQQGFLSSVPGRWGCRCPYCQKGFQEMFGGSMPRDENQDVLNYKKAALKDFLENLMQPLAENKIKNYLYLTANVEPPEAKAEWEYFAEIPYLDSLSTGPYWIWQKKPIEIVTGYSQVIRQLCREHQLDPQLWLQCCKIPKGREEEILEGVKLAKEAGIKDVAFWGFEGCAHETWISCEDPDKAWETVIKAMAVYSSDTK